MRLDQPGRTPSARSPTRGCSPPRPTGARTGSASSTPRSPSPTARRRTSSRSVPAGGEPTRITSLADDGGFAAEPGLAARRQRSAVQRSPRRGPEPVAAHRAPRRQRSRLRVRRRHGLRAAPAGAADALTPRSPASRPSRPGREGRGVVHAAAARPRPGRRRCSPSVVETKAMRSVPSSSTSGVHVLALGEHRLQSPRGPPDTVTFSSSAFSSVRPRDAEHRVHRAPVAVDVQRHAERRGRQVGQHRAPRRRRRPASRAARRTSARVSGSDTHVPSSGFGSAPRSRGGRSRVLGGGRRVVRPLGDGHGDRRDSGRGTRSAAAPRRTTRLAAMSGRQRRPRRPAPARPSSRSVSPNASRRRSSTDIVGHLLGQGLGEVAAAVCSWLHPVDSEQPRISAISLIGRSSK